MIDDVILGLITVFALFSLGGVGVLVGGELTERGNVAMGRNQGIVFCTENPKQCAVEYAYLKLKNNQKEQ
jgi:hypothetical protein